MRTHAAIGSRPRPVPPISIGRIARSATTPRRNPPASIATATLVGPFARNRGPKPNTDGVPSWDGSEAEARPRPPCSNASACTSFAASVTEVSGWQQVPSDRREGATHRRQGEAARPTSRRGRRQRRWHPGVARHRLCPRNRSRWPRANPRAVRQAERDQRAAVRTERTRSWQRSSKRSRMASNRLAACEPTWTSCEPSWARWRKPSGRWPRPSRRCWRAVGGKTAVRLDRQRRRSVRLPPRMEPPPAKMRRRRNRTTERQQAKACSGFRSQRQPLEARRLL
jgi:hypothetical protein